MVNSGGDIAGPLLTWFEQHGRHDLPWQVGDPYRVWVSEIMLQQTQVTTVLGYYGRFVDRFPDVQTLAAAPQDEVLHLWSGLGYYARARNLHAAARQIVAAHQGVVPRNAEALQALPGIGRSTAGAILALTWGDRQPILDGNVKRVLGRYHRIPGWPGSSRVAREYWQIAERHTPQQRVREYTQAIMDLGASVCTRGAPRCPECPVRRRCEAAARGDMLAYPHRKPKTGKPIRHRALLVIRRGDGCLLLEKRPPTGIWGGLWSFPERERVAENAIAPWCENLCGVGPQAVRLLPSFDHLFTHFRLTAAPVLCDIKADRAGIMEAGSRLWYNPEQPDGIGLPAPVRRLIREVTRPDAVFTPAE